MSTPFGHGEGQTSPVPTPGPGRKSQDQIHPIGWPGDAESNHDIKEILF